MILHRAISLNTTAGFAIYATIVHAKLLPIWAVARRGYWHVNLDAQLARIVIFIALNLA